MLSATATQMHNEPEKLLTAPQLAATLGLHVKTVYDLAARKKLPSYKIGAALRFRQSEIEQWLAGQRAA